jgi:hypothetical protein
MTVPRTTNKPEIDTLPEPELNPVMNPLLAAHMGRWAEVYFTTLPENRAQAVAELLRELQNGSLPESTSFPVPDHETHEKEVEREEAPDAPPQFSEAASISAAHWSQHEPFVGARFPEYAIGASSLKTAREGQDEPEVGWTLQARNLSHFDAGLDHKSEVGRRPFPYRYRIYGGVALAILLIFLLYTAWRDTKSTPRVAPTQPPVSITAPEASPPDSPVPTKSNITAPSRKRRPAGTSTASPAVTTAKGQPVEAEQGGVNEFVTAERYLKGTLGTTPDSRVAALWLWKAISKKNSAAMIALSDLYLRGDGVPKSCDQARMLLDAAARKGETAAAERLRHLQAFGCE